MPSEKVLKRSRRHLKIRKKVRGTAERPRLVVFRSLTDIYGQLVDDDARNTLFSESSLKVKKGTKTEKAKEAGRLLAQKALEKNITTVVFDRNGYKFHGRVKALAESAREAGLKF